MRAYAKINIGLHILGKRDDGYTNINTVFHRIDLFDELHFSPSKDIVLHSSSPDIPTDSRNICVKAVYLLREHFNCEDGVVISLRKNIPVGAGLGGGSADAAVVLKEVPKLWGRELDEASGRSLALRLGSDVPYFLDTGSACATGRGETLEYFNLTIPYCILLCYPGIHVSTAWAYQQVHPDPANASSDLRALLLEGLHHPEHLRQSVHNDFEPAVFSHHPKIRKLKDTMLRSDAVFALMSGSGSSVYGFFPDENAATRCARALHAQGYRTFLTRPGFTPDPPTTDTHR